jgi:hypothetical protein
MAPQVRIGEDGQLIVDTSSLTVQAQQQELSTFRRVDEQVRIAGVGWALSVCRGTDWVCVRGWRGRRNSTRVNEKLRKEG